MLSGKTLGIETPQRSESAKLGRKLPKNGSNDDWTHRGDPDARITKMKDARTHLAHKLEQASNMDSGAVVTVNVQTIDGGDSASKPGTLEEAGSRLAALDIEPKDVPAHNRYHCNGTMKGLKANGLRSYVSEPDQGRRNRKCGPDAQNPTCANRDGLGVIVASGCCAGVARSWNGRLRTFWRPAGCAVCMSAGRRTSASVCRVMRRPSISAY